MVLTSIQLFSEYVTVKLFTDMFKFYNYNLSSRLRYQTNIKIITIVLPLDSIYKL